MTDCHGFEPEYARKVLEGEGFIVYMKEVRSKKGVNGDSCRVIRQKQLDDGTIELCFSHILSRPVCAADTDTEL